MLISKRTWDVVLIGTSPLCGHDSSKDGNGSDLMSGKVGGPSIDIFVDFRGQVSGVEIGEHIFYLWDKIPWYYEERIVNGCSGIGKEMGETTAFERRKMA
ncbi:hypothetical protein Q3G72_019279 [Acer saccharum]|nr:hypothetical protein Q3G72_019279 [Acer saccharum]